MRQRHENYVRPESASRPALTHVDVWLRIQGFGISDNKQPHLCYEIVGSLTTETDQSLVRSPPCAVVVRAIWDRRSAMRLKVLL